MKSTLIALTFLLAASFIMGVDHKLDQIEQANKADRERIYCAMPGHSETYCNGKL